MRNKHIVIVDYGLGNLFSVKLACDVLGLEATITSDSSMIEKADGLILPGVGAFGDAMESLERLDLINPIRNFAQSGKPLMGVCLGMQLLFSESEEFRKVKGLNIIPGKIVKLRSVREQSVKIPQIGWNTILPKERSWMGTPLEGKTSASFMYFVHSYFALPEHDEVRLSSTIYGPNHYCSSILMQNIFATQFHPEKSAQAGLGIYRKWATINNLIDTEQHDKGSKPGS